MDINGGGAEEGLKIAVGEILLGVRAQGCEGGENSGDKQADDDEDDAHFDQSKSALGERNSVIPAQAGIHLLCVTFTSRSQHVAPASLTGDGFPPARE